MPRRPLVLLVTLVAAAPAVAASPAGRPRPGARYDGKVSGGAPAVVVVARSAKRLQSFSADVRHGRCPDGSPFRDHFDTHGQPPVVFDEGGTFDWSTAGEGGRYAGRGGKFRFFLRGAFSSDGNRVRGKFRETFTSRRFRCDTGFVSYTAYRDGSRRAPLRDTRTRTGRYRLAGRGLRGMRLRVFLPRRHVVRLAFGWTARCKPRAALQGHEEFRDLPLHAGRFGVRGTSPVSVGAGLRSRDSYRLTGRFVRVRGVYYVFGSWRVKAPVLRGRKVVYRCGTGVRRFAGRWAAPR